MDRKSLLAERIVNYSISLKRGEKVWLEYSNVDYDMIHLLVQQITKKGGIPILKHYEPKETKYLMKYASVNALQLLAEQDRQVMEKMDCVILLKGEDNKYEFSDVPLEKRKLYDKYYREVVHNRVRINKKWVLLRYPTSAFAQSSKMSSEDFWNYYFKVCCLDYSKMCKAMTPLQKLMEKTDKVHIVAKDTDLTFSIKGIPAVKCCGDKNIPDGELYTAPVKNSINGKIFFNVPMAIDGNFYNGIRLEFRDGKVVNCDNPNFDKVLNTDEGARYVGEFSFGLNPYMTRPISDILFDEKMAKSIHMAMGNSYDDASNGNHSAIHIDLIHSHSKEYGGGEIYFDDVLIRKNGLFIPNNLLVLNPDSLV